MKKYFLAVLCLLLTLTGCGREKTNSGPVVAVLENPDAVIVKVAGGEETAFLIGEDTMTFSWVEGVEMEDLEPGMRVSADYSGWKKTFTASDGKEYPSYEAMVFTIDEAREKDPVVLSDGTEVWCWRGIAVDRYCLEDGTELMWSENAGADIYTDLASQEVNEKIRIYFEEQGLHYDPAAELERAYEAWQRKELGETFGSYHASQFTYRGAVSERVLYYSTTVTIPVAEQEGAMSSLSTAFDRQTGEVIPMGDLFACEPGEAVTAILDGAAITGENLRKEMQAAFRPEYAVFSADGHLEVTFPQGSLPSQAHSFIISVETGKVEQILKPWAVPVPAE